MSVVLKDSTSDDDLCRMARESTNVDALGLLVEELHLRARRRLVDAADRCSNIGSHTWLRGSLATTLDLLTAADVAQLRLHTLTRRTP